MSSAGRQFINRRSGFTGRRRRTGFGKGFTTGGVGAKGGRGMISIRQQNRLAPMDQRIVEAARLSIRDLINSGLSHLQKITPSRTGRMKRGYRKVIQRFFGRIVTDTPYQIFVEKDTKPHEIKARFAAALKIEIGSQTLFRVRVQHPGTRGQRLVERTVRFVKSRIPQTTKLHMRNIGKF